MRYKALALQTSCQAINPCKSIEEARIKIASNIERVHRQIKASKNFIGHDLKLVVLPEYFATGFPLHESMEEWQTKACYSVNDPLFEMLTRIAVDTKVYLSGNFYETDIHFPSIYFQSSFVIDPQGKLILKYRRLNSMFAITPYDVLDEYLRIYGEESLFPVVATEIGNLACIASEEILYPEIARCLMMRGAEVFCHHTSEVCSPLTTSKNIAKQARAIENMAYVVSANTAEILHTDFPSASTDGGSKIIQYDGLCLVESGQGESMVANATIDLDALRNHRQRPGMSNFISRQRNELFAQSYKKFVFYPANLWHSNFKKSDFIQNQQSVIDKLYNKALHGD
jgi:predicted amidohydrolase